MKTVQHLCRYSTANRVWRMEATLIFLILIFTKPNTGVSGWLFLTKTHFTHIVYQPFSRVSPPSFTLYVELEHRFHLEVCLFDLYGMCPSLKIPLSKKYCNFRYLSPEGDPCSCCFSCFSWEKCMDMSKKYIFKLDKIGKLIFMAQSPVPKTISIIRPRTLWNSNFDKFAKMLHSWSYIVL